MMGLDDYMSLDVMHGERAIQGGVSYLFSVSRMLYIALPVGRSKHITNPDQSGSYCWIVLLLPNTPLQTGATPIGCMLLAFGAW